MWFLCGLVEQFHDVSWSFHAFVAGVSLSSLAFALGAPPSARILHSRGWPVGGASCLAHLREDLHVKIPTQIPRNPGIFGHLCNFSNMFESYVFPQQRKLGVFSHSKGSGASRSSQIRTAQGWEPGSQEGFPFPRESLGAAKSAQSKVGNRVRRKRFPSNVPRKRFQSNVPRKRSQVRFPRSSQEQVPKQRLPARGSQARFPGTGSQARFPGRGSQQSSQAKFPGKLTRNRFPSKGSQQEVPKQEEVTKRKVFRKRFSGKVPKRFQARFPGTSSQARVPQARVPHQGVPKQGFPGRGSQARVPRKRFPGTGSQARFPRTGLQASKLRKNRFPSKGSGSKNKFSRKVPSNRLPARFPRTRSQPWASPIDSNQYSQTKINNF